MHDFEIAQCKLQIVQLRKSCVTVPQVYVSTVHEGVRQVDRVAVVNAALCIAMRDKNCTQPSAYFSRNN